MTSTSLPAGYKLHWYEIKSVLGRGGFGITYLAEDKNLGVLVAIKEYLPSDVADRSQDSTVHPTSGEHSQLYHWGLDRFMKEARTLVRFKHPNIVSLHSVFEANNTAYMVMEYEQGEDLAQVYRQQGQLSQAKLLGIFAPVVEGLDCIHQAGYLHRDIKPANIFLRQEDGSPVLLDFGSARQLLTDRSQAMTSLVSVGYTPFEQYSDNFGDQGPWTDIYALSASLYIGVSGKAPVDALTRSTAFLANKPDIYSPLQNANLGQYSENFLAAIDWGLQFHIVDRPKSTAEWLAKLQGEVDSASGSQNQAALDHDATRLMPGRQKLRGKTGSSSTSAGATNGHEITRERVAPSQAQLDAMTGEDGRSGASASVLSSQTGASSGDTQWPDDRTPLQSKVQVKEKAESPATSQGKGKRIAAVMAVLVALVTGGIYLAMQKLATPPTSEQKSQPTSQVKSPATQEQAPLAATPAPPPAEPVTPPVLDFPKLTGKQPASTPAAFLQQRQEALQALADAYLTALETNPENSQAQQGLDQIAQDYLQLSQQAQPLLGLEAATEIIQQGLQFSPDNSALLKRQAALEDIHSGRTDIMSLVESWLAKAEQYVALRQFTQPANQNAVGAYQQVLALAPDHTEAREQLIAMADIFEGKAVQALQQKQSERALDILSQGLLIYPKHEGLQALRNSLLEE